MKNKIVLILLFLLITIASSGQITEKFLVKSKTLNMRSGPDKSYDILFTLSIGDQVSVVEKNSNGWWLVEYNSAQGYVFSQFLKRDPYFDWNKTYYQSGETPECENVDPQYDRSLDNYLKVNVGSHTDVVIKLMKRQFEGDICIRIVYIRSNETFFLRNIPEGNYYLKIAYGSDWRQKIVDNKCYGKFMQNAQYEIGKEELDFNVRRRNDRIQVPSFELSLDVIIRKSSRPTFNANEISEKEFNK